MSGNDKSKNVESRLQEFQNKLKVYTDSIGLNKVSYNSDIEHIINLDRSILQKMSSMDCDESAFLLSQYANFLQKEENNYKIEVLWAEKHLERIVAENETNYTGGSQFVKYELLKQKVILGNSAAKALNGIIVNASARALALSQLSNKMLNMANYLSQLSRSKRG